LIDSTISTSPHGPEPEASDGGLLELAPGVRASGSILRFAFSRSGGPGGQNVNKLSTKAELRVGLVDLPISDRARHRLADAAGRRVTDEGVLVLVSEVHRSQSRNKTECLDKLRELLVSAIAEPKYRRKTKPTRGSKERRLTEKKVRGDVKRTRKSKDDHD
jgi:ribosome-associated protein